MRAILISHGAEKQERDKLRNYLKSTDIIDTIVYESYSDLEKSYSDLDPDENFIYFPSVAVRYKNLNNIIKLIKKSNFDFVLVGDLILSFKTREMAVNGSIISFSNKGKYFIKLSDKDNARYLDIATNKVIK